MTDLQPADMLHFVVILQSVFVRQSMFLFDLLAALALVIEPQPARLKSLWEIY